MARHLIVPGAKRLVSGVVMAVAMAGSAQATDSFNSEISHVAGGAAMAGVATYFADDHWPQDRGWIGFSTSVELGVALEGVDSANGNKFSVLDAASNALGAAVGAFATDHYILMPAVEPPGKQGAFLGVTGKFKF